MVCVSAMAAKASRNRTTSWAKAVIFVLASLAQARGILNQELHLPAVRVAPAPIGMPDGTIGHFGDFVIRHQTAVLAFPALVGRAQARGVRPRGFIQTHALLSWRRKDGLFRLSVLLFIRFLLVPFEPEGDACPPKPGGAPACETQNSRPAYDNVRPDHPSRNVHNPHVLSCGDTAAANQVPSQSP